MESDALTQLIQALPTLMATRYFALIACVLLLWDNLLTFKDEIKYIWGLPVELTKLVFVFNRYVVAGSVCWGVYILVDLRGSLTHEICRNYIVYISCVSLVAITVANLTVIFHIQALWEKQPIITYVLLVGFIITYGVTAVCSGFVLEDFRARILWIPEMNSCAVPHKPMTLIGVWGGMVTFDIFMLGMVFTNAVNRPYRENSEVVHNLHKDGIKFFMVLLAVRVFNLLIAIFSTPKFLLMLAFFTWAIASVTLSRFLLMVKAMEATVSKEGSGPPIVWRNESGYWSRECNLIELKSTPRSSR